MVQACICYWHILNPQKISDKDTLGKMLSLAVFLAYRGMCGSKILDGRKQGLIVLGKIVNFYWLLINNSSGYWKLADSYKGKSGRREAFRLSLFILINDIQITQKYTLVIVDTLGVFLVNIIFINIILITQIYTLSENNLKVFFVIPTTASDFLFYSTW